LDGDLVSSIRPALPEEAAEISVVALRSKAHWGYAGAQMAVFGPELTLSASELVARKAHVFEEGGRIVGFFTLMGREEGVGELEHIFVDPTRLRRGIGAALFRHACVVAREAGWRRLVIQSDPNAAGFYQRMGARLERYIPSSIPGRKLPLFSIALPGVRRTEAFH
jgi:GNAT superfamily N-acetyltransferase